ncbi:MAG: hypothetical protein L6V93_10460 [Clostridiales bacterium]|nr:MAG: hypothetical protein L6V93_10460 [Clostridiales bacterium]
MIYIRFLYMESKNHNVEIYLKSGKTVTTRTALTDIKNLFSNISGFYIGRRIVYCKFTVRAKAFFKPSLLWQAGRVYPFREE